MASEHPIPANAPSQTTRPRASSMKSASSGRRHQKSPSVTFDASPQTERSRTPSSTSSSSFSEILLNSSHPHPPQDELSYIYSFTATDRTSTSAVPTTEQPTKSHQQPQQQPKSKAPGFFRGIFSTKEPSRDAFEQLAKQQRLELAQKGLQYPAGVPRGKIPATAAAKQKESEAYAKRRAKIYQNMKREAGGQKRPVTSGQEIPSSPPLYRPDTVTHNRTRSNDPAVQPDW